MMVLFRLPSGRLVNAQFNGAVPRQGEVVDFDACSDTDGNEVTGKFDVSVVTWAVTPPPERPEVYIVLEEAAVF